MILDHAPSKALRRAAALALAVLPLALVGIVAAGFLVARGEHHRRVERLLVERETYRAATEAAPEWQARIAALRKDEAGGALFYPLAQSSRAATQMETVLDGLVARNGGTVLHDNVELHDSGGDAPQELRATASFNADITQLTHILHDLRRARPLLFVDRLEVKSAPDAQGKAQLAGPNKLQADATIVAYLGPR